VRPGRSWEGKGWGGPRGAFAVPTLRNEQERIDSILGDRPARFNIEDNPEADPGPGFWELSSLGKSSVDRYDDAIERAAKKRGVDPDLIRSVMWAENARGHYGGLNQVLDMIGSSRTKLPMKHQAALGSVDWRQSRGHD
jgi:hypothetical protein